MANMFDSLKRFFTRGRGRQQQPAPQPQNIPPEYQEPEEDETDIIIQREYIPEENQQPPEYIEQQPAEPEDECVQGYIEKRSEGRSIRVHAQYYVTNPNIDCIRSLLNTVGRKQFYTLIICGTPYNEYPGHEGEESICLGYVRDYNFVVQAAYGASVETAEDFANSINEEPYRRLDHWVHIDSIAILDK